MVKAQPDAHLRTLAARTALRPWLDSLDELEQWFATEAARIWPDEPQRHARDRIALLQATLSAMARGNEAIARPGPASAAALAPERIDMLMAHARPQRARTAVDQAEQRRAAVLDLALWNALRLLSPGGGPHTQAPTLAGLAPWLARPTPLAPGISPTPAYAETAQAQRFFGETVAGVMARLATKKAGEGMAAFACATPTQPFDGRLPAVVAWSQAWSVAVAGVYLDNLRRHSGDNLHEALRAIWSGRLSAVRFRTGPGLTALPSRDGALHLDLWTCPVKAQALAFDPAVWDAQAAGTRWHAVRVDMHELARRTTAAPPAAEVALRKTASGLGVESLYRSVFVDRLHQVASQAWGDGHTAEPAYAAAGPLQPGTIAIEVDRPPDGQLPNLRLLLRWREPSDGMLRSTGADPASGPAAAARVLPAARIDWHAAAAAVGKAPTTHAAAAPLGDAALWAGMDPAVQWLDAALVARVDGAWHELPLVLDDLAPGSCEAPRTQWSLAAGAVLPHSLDLPTLLRAVHEHAMHWSVHEQGLGAFLMAVVDVDAWRLAQPA